MQHFGWTWTELLWGIPWGVVVRMLSDQSRWDSEAEDKPSTETKGQPFETADEIAEAINRLGRG